jgi:hypothetical protein
MATSFRDPAGHLLQVNERILRIINHSGEADLRAFLDSGSARQLIASGSLVDTRVLGYQGLANLTVVGELPDQLAQSDAALIVEHERVPFQSFPYEWPPEMLHAAGQLTLDLAESLLDDGFGLKDATPYNVLFHGPRPVFVDWLSFERRDPLDATWLPYAQFVRTFLLPLLVNKHFHLRFDQLLLANRDGLEPEQVYHLAGPVRRLLPPFVALVSLPAWLAKKGNTEDQKTYRPRRSESKEKARFIISHLLKGLRRKLRAVAPKEGKTSTWSDYTSKNRYTEDYIPLKQSFVETAIDEWGCSRVLDVGCNTGFFSALAARRGASVVAIDYDPVVVGEVWRRAQAESLDILPLVVNLARPTPSTGWLNDECPSFLERARGSFDAVLMLAIIHHMLVSERIPLPQIIKLASEMTTKLLVIEYVSPDDPMFRRITRGREYLHQDLTRESFETACQPLFETVRMQRLGDSGRWIYLLRKRAEVR